MNYRKLALLFFMPLLLCIRRASRIRIRIRHYLYGSGSEGHHQAKNVRKTLVSDVFEFFVIFYL
jgi:hypothetical protein